jgi:MarR family transcriptional regulator, lower aerobic nicotinate degradation pathway regulator
MADSRADPGHDSAGAWAKKYHQTSRMVMESVLRPHDLGPTQWYVLFQLATEGATPQRDLVRMLQVERATLTGVVTALVRKGLVGQETDPTDQRQKILSITEAGRSLWAELPDPIGVILDTAFRGVPAEDVATTTRVLQAATERLQTLLGPVTR